ncbi:MAG: DUF1015 domain-containing protein [Clostridiales bacterium]|nr:DUF1015 domain-containing protein [Clostridiales bacterium]
MRKLFVPADILIPQEELLPLWSVVACDQYTSEPEYWDRVTEKTAGVPSARHIIFPEAYLETSDAGEVTAKANAEMEKYLSSGVFRKFSQCYVFVTRTLRSGTVRHGLMGAVDLSQYDYSAGSKSPIRATEKTVLERIPPRVSLRREAPLELPHILMLCEDFDCNLPELLSKRSAEMTVVYDFDLMENSGHITGRLVSGSLAEEVSALLDKLTSGSIGIAIGDGNHSLAAAKACFDELCEKIGMEAAMSHPARYALAELENIADEGIAFEPIHRLALCSAGELLGFIASKNYRFSPVEFFAGEQRGTLCVCPDGETLPCAGLQSLLDEFAASHACTIDYIHGDDTARRLGCADGAVSFLLPAFPKPALFPTVEREGTLPRKAFSMGHAEDKRFYLEARTIR